jgi:hypothetical protein
MSGDQFSDFKVCFVHSGLTVSRKLSEYLEPAQQNTLDPIDSIEALARLYGSGESHD